MNSPVFREIKMKQSGDCQRICLKKGWTDSQEAQAMDSSDKSNAVWSTRRTADLRFADSRRLSVAHRTNIQTLFSFQISLSEELLHDTLSPLLVQR